MTQSDRTEAARLIYSLENSHPVELFDFTSAMLGVADEYKRFSAARAEGMEEATLYIKEVRQGSIVTEMVALVPVGMAAAVPFIENSNAVIEFGRNLIDTLNFFKGSSTSAPQELSRQNLQNLDRILEPVAKDSGAQINIGVLNINGNVSITINNQEANASQNKIRKQIEALKEPVSGVHEQVVMRWHQARNDGANTGDKAIIESISPNPVKVVFAHSHQKHAALSRPDENPFMKPLVVDVQVETVRGRPVLYRVLTIHDDIDISQDSP